MRKIALFLLFPFLLAACEKDTGSCNQERQSGCDKYLEAATASVPEADQLPDNLQPLPLPPPPEDAPTELIELPPEDASAASAPEATEESPVHRDDML